jgi:Delta7-sterol 5-desaturase
MKENIMQQHSQVGFAQALAIWPIVWANDAGRYLLAAGLTAFALWALKRWRHSPGWAARQVRIRRERPHQRWIELALSMRTALLFSLFGTFVWWGGQRGFFQLYHSVADYGCLYWAASLIAIVVLHDAWFYWTHRLLHCSWLMRHTHRTHHQSLAPTPWTAYSFGLLDACIQALFLPLLILVMPLHGGVLAMWGIHQIVRNAWGHSGAEVIPLAWLEGFWGRWLTTTLHHEMHHAHGGPHNFGLYFRWWDRACGTEHPQYAQELASLCQRVRALRPASAQPVSAILLGLALTGCMACAALSLSPSIRAQTVPSIATDARGEVRGEWVTQGHSARVRVRACEGQPDQLCGRVLWLWEPLDILGKPLSDSHNPDPALRSRPVVGLDIIHGFRPSGTPGLWTQGNIYNPEDGRTYNATLRLRNADTLELEGCVLFLCAKQVWRRLPASCWLKG